MKENTNAPIYTLTGTVIHGRGIGKHVGTPTANMEIAKNTFLPKTGVYVADILLSDNRYYGVTHIGARPTLDNDDSVSIETHIFDFDKDKNLLVTGTSGSGKTNLFRNIIMNVLINYTDTKIIILDTQSINYNDFANVCEVVNGKDDVIKKIKLLRREFEERVKNGNRERILVFIDEIYEILEMDNSVDEDINYLLSLGDKCNIHLIVSTDTLSNDDMVRIFTNNNTCKISFYMTTRGEYNIFLSNIVNESLNNDGMYLDSDKNLSRVIIPLIGQKQRFFIYPAYRMSSEEESSS